jgi:hypothetical protein
MAVAGRFGLLPAKLREIARKPPVKESHVLNPARGDEFL